MTWVKLDDEFYDHPKWVGAPGDSIALWVAMLAWCNRNDSITGYIPALKTVGLVNVRNVKTTLSDLCRRGAIRPLDDGYTIHDYVDYQQPEKVRAIAVKRAEAGKRGAAKRWTGHIANGQASDIANAIASVNGKGMANEWPVPDPVPDPYLQLETSSRLPTADDEMAKRIGAIAAALIDWRTRDDPPRDRAAYYRKAVPNVVDQHGPRIAQLIGLFPCAPVDSIVHALESGDTRNLAMFAADESNVVDMPARKLNREERIATLADNGAPVRFINPNESPL